MSSSSIAVQNVKPVFLQEGKWNFYTLPLYANNFVYPQFEKIAARNETRINCDETYSARAMMKKEGNMGRFTHISLPFSPSPIKGAYICVRDYHAPLYLIFTFTFLSHIDSSKKEQISKKYEFPKVYTCEMYFYLPIDLEEVVLCEITGKGKDEFFEIFSFEFIREETSEEIMVRKAKEAAREKLWAESVVVKPKFVQKGNTIPIPRDDPKVINPAISLVKSGDYTKRIVSKWYDQSSSAQRMLKGESDVFLSHLFIPFSSPSPMKGAYICVNRDYSSPSLVFTFTDYDGKKTSIMYEFTRLETWLGCFFLPIDLDNIILCEIDGKGRWVEKGNRSFCIGSIIFTMSEEVVEADRLSLLPWEPPKDVVLRKEEEEEKE
ncbi:hypothetical protein ADUPG1_011657 [Aduncisulcus paluster]|uniref:Uncharacterized protein n=1 Tax=Aduncisulcus paluster TaxID=2918883 RepID=A0ABQ5JWK6_9EUKA|nr:hypothetical protein ADUPG1_011657 [Aduncisulcus paluster]